ncbi:uncharacterized protein [Penaeus vannamei]|uniref:uncharacterized protein n=1 Tax=Penaeus vannamei TaxID=6689 RepID=UPI00387F520E
MTSTGASDPRRKRSKTERPLVILTFPQKQQQQYTNILSKDEISRKRRPSKSYRSRGFFPQKGHSYRTSTGRKTERSRPLNLSWRECALYKLEGEAHTKLGVFHADHLKKLKNGFRVTLETQMTSDDVDGGRRPKKKTKRQREASSVMLTFPQEQQEECMNLLSRMSRFEGDGAIPRSVSIFAL